MTCRGATTDLDPYPGWSPAVSPALSTINTLPEADGKRRPRQFELAGTAFPDLVRSLFPGPPWSPSLYPCPPRSDSLSYAVRFTVVGTPGRVFFACLTSDR